MKRLAVFIVLSMVLTLSIFAQTEFVGSTENINVTLHLDTNIGTFSEIASSDEQDDIFDSYTKSDCFVFFGSLTKPNLISDEPLLAVSELMEGRWIDSGTVVLDAVSLVFTDEVFRDFLDIAGGRRLIVIANNPHFDTDSSGKRIVAFNVKAARILE